MNQIINSYRNSEKRLIILAYDSILADFILQPEPEGISAQLAEVIRNISKTSGNTLCIVSGRKADDLEKWFSQFNITLVAEHGYLYKLPSTGTWLQMANVDVSWKKAAREVLKKQVLQHPGSFIEEKIYSLTWHYRKISDNINDKILLDLNKSLDEINTNNTFKLVHDNNMLEAKSVSINKGLAMQKLLTSADFDFVMAIGDDHTDEGMFEALTGETHVTINVGPGPDTSKAKYNLLDIHHVVSFLGQMDRPS